MVDKPVTRRSALWLGAAILAGLNVVFFALRSRRGASLPPGRFFREWDSIVKRLDVPVKAIDGPSSFTLAYRPQDGKKLRVLVVDTNYGAAVRTAKYPQPPSFFLLTEARLVHKSRVVEDKPAVTIVAEKSSVNFPDKIDERAVGECIAVIDDGAREPGTISFFETSGGSPRECPISEINAACWRIARTLRQIYKPGETLAKGAAWSVSESVFGFEIPVEVAGFAEVNGKATARISGRRRLSSPEVADYMLWMAKEDSRRQPASAAQRGPTREESDRDRKEIIDRQETREYELTAFVDLQRGIAVRQEFTGTIHVPGEAPTVGGSIFQLYDDV